MPSIYFDHAGMTDDERRRRIFAGDIFLGSPQPGISALCDFARALIEEAFGDADPQEAQFQMPVEEFVRVVAPLKTKFTNDRRTKELMREALAGLGCDLDETYFDVPRLRVVTHGGYLTAGVGYAYKPHRDTWYAAPLSQVNWWAPVYPLTAERALIFYPSYFDRAVRNSSHEFDYDEWCRVGRQQAVSQVEVDTRNHPLAQEPIGDYEELRVVCGAAAALAFSGNQLHATAPNTSGRTRFSIDFRTVHLEDLRAGRGAPNTDSAATGTTVRDHIRASDFAPLPAEYVEHDLAVKR